MGVSVSGKSSVCSMCAWMCACVKVSAGESDREEVKSIVSLNDKTRGR